MPCTGWPFTTSPTPMPVPTVMYAQEVSPSFLSPHCRRLGLERKDGSGESERAREKGAKSHVERDRASATYRLNKRTCERAPKAVPSFSRALLLYSKYYSSRAESAVRGYMSITLKRKRNGPASQWRRKGLREPTAYRRGLSKRWNTPHTAVDAAFSSEPLPKATQFPCMTAENDGNTLMRTHSSTKSTLQHKRVHILIYSYAPR